MKKITSVLLVVLSVLMIASSMVVSVGAASAYQTYTYDINGYPLYSPDAYSAEDALTFAEMGIPIDPNASKGITPKDMVTDDEGNIYIADAGYNRIIVLDPYYQYKFSIDKFITGQHDNLGGNDDSFASPSGVFVTETEIWVCDTNNARLVVFNRQGEYIRTVGSPPTNVLATYAPIAMAIDQYGRIFVVSKGCGDGIIVLDSMGSFVGFIGAQKVAEESWFDIIYARYFQSEEDKAKEDQAVPPGYNNICITDSGFIYVTSNELSDKDVESAIKSEDPDGMKLPVKLLNPSGEEIMRRNGFWPPAGEIDFKVGSDENAQTAGGVSSIIDVATGPEMTWSIFDSKRQKFYTYDYNGNLLFAFGDTGSVLGNLSSVSAICYQGDKLLALDSNSGISVYSRTPYGDLLIKAIAAENSLDYAYAIECWQEVLQANANFDAAYVGIGNSLYRSGRYEESLAYFEKAYDVENWSSSYKEVRKEWMSKWLIPMILGIVAVLVLFAKFLGWAAKVNKRVATDGKERKTFGQELLYGFYTIFHPFDGYYDLKHEHRGSLRAAIVFLALTIITFFYQSVGLGYVMNPTGATANIFTVILLVVIVVMLFVIGNWCLTTLFEGEGSMKDIFIATCYSLLPFILLNIPATIASNIVTVEEAGIISMISTVSFVWLGFLLFFGTMVTHDYSLGKNFLTIIFTIVAMIFIVFLVLLFGVLVSKMVSLVSNIVTEIQYRA